MKLANAIGGIISLAFIVETAKSQTEICLRQADFEHGTKIIDTPGYYKLCENVSFRPNWNGGDTTITDMETIFDPDFTIYSPNNYGLGFFAAIAVQTGGVVIDLNGFTLEQSVEHALMQRFFALIELANAPFIRSAGPAQFVGTNETFTPASDFVLKGPGTLGRSSHHGVHGNENTNVRISEVTFKDFEVAAVSLNRVTQLTINDCTVLGSRKDVPVMGLFSAARFIRPYLKKLTESNYSMHLRGVTTDASTLYNNLLTSIKNVFDDVSKFGAINPSTHPDEHRLFDNPKRVVDGPCYAFLVHGRGPAVGDFPDTRSQNVDVLSQDIFIEDNTIQQISCWNDEVLAALEDGRPVNDVRGAIFQFFKTFGPENERHLAALPSLTPSGNVEGYIYTGNAVADAQVMVAKAVLDGVLTATPELQTIPNSINMNIISWAMSADDLYLPKFRCNGDSMHHVIKGIVVIRIDDCLGFKIQGNHISNVENLSEPPFENCFDYHTTSSENTDSPQQAGNIRAISAAAVAGYVPGMDGTFAQKGGAPVVKSATPAPTAGATTLAPTAGATTLTPTAGATTLTPTAGATTLAPTAGATTLAPTVGATTLAPTPAPTTLAPTSVPTLAPLPHPTQAPGASSVLVNWDFENDTIYPWDFLGISSGTIELAYDSDRGSHVGKVSGRDPNHSWEGLRQDVTGIIQVGEDYNIQISAKLVDVPDGVKSLFLFTLQIDYADGTSDWKSPIWTQDLTNQWQTFQGYMEPFEPVGAFTSLWVYAEGPSGHSFAIDDVIMLPDLTTPVHPTGDQGTEAECSTTNLDFSSLKNGDWLRDQLWDSHCVKVTAWGYQHRNSAGKRAFTPINGVHQAAGGAARVFDTGNKSNCDEDLMSPSPKFYNGPNVNCWDCCGGGPFLMDLIMGLCVYKNGKQTPNPYKNDKYLGNVLVIQEFQGGTNQQEMNSCPDDSAYGGIIKFQFCKPVTFKAAGLFDINFAGDVLLIFHYEDGSQKTVVADPTGDNGYMKSGYDEANVVSIDIDYWGSGGLESIDYSYCDGTSSTRSLVESEANFSQLHGQLHEPRGLRGQHGQLQPPSSRHPRQLRQLQVPTADSIIAFNEIYGVFSRPSMPCIGIDLQGTSEQVELLDNVIDLDPNDRGGGNSNNIGVRIRPLVNKSKVKKQRNKLPQGLVEEQSKFGGQSLVVTPDGHPDVTEWELGELPGCPFSNR